jgi:3-oxoacyl-[acyl-carrier protein] reductase
MNQPITIITGAGSGVGRSLAIALAAQGHHIALAGRTRSKLEETALRLHAYMHVLGIRE